MDAQAMHVAGGTINGPVTIVFSLLALAALTVCAAKARDHLNPRLVATAAAAAVFVFAAQLISHEIVPGVSGHLLGGTLAAMLAGPWAGALAMTVVLIAHCLLSGAELSALGLNVLNLAILGTAVTYLLVAAALRRLPKDTDGLAAMALIASIVSVAAAALGVTAEYALGAAQPVASLVPTAGTQLLISLGEGLITATVVVGVARFRPGLVHALGGFPRRARPARRGQPGPNFRRRAHIKAPPAWDPEDQGGMFRIARRRGQGGLPGYY